MQTSWYTAIVVVSVAALPAGAQTASPADTLRLEVGSPHVNGTIYAPHAARVRVRVGEGEGRLTAEWTNELTHGDSAGRAVHRWVTKGTRFLPSGDTVRWEILQTYDARTLAPYAYTAQSSTGTFTRLTMDGRRVRGTRKVSPDSAERAIDLMVDRPGFIASASDLIPLAAGLREGAVMTAPMWGPNMPASELRVFTVLGKVPVDVEGTRVIAWKITEHRHADRKLLATWYMVEESPYMVYGEVPLPNGQVQRMTEVAIPASPR